MTFDLILSSLYYHGREWFVFEDILTHLPQEKAAAASERSKTTQKYTYRFGITRAWVTGEGRKTLVDRHFIDSNDPGRSLIFSSVLVDAANVEELFRESFNKRFRLKVQQFHLTATSLGSAWFEWQFDPKQKGGCAVKKTKLSSEETPSNILKDQTTHQNGGKTSTPKPTQQCTNSPQSLKRKRALENGRLPVANGTLDQQSNNYVSSISESVLMKPRKKAKEANMSIMKYVNDQDDEEKLEVPKDEPMSSDFKPDLAKFPELSDIKRSPHSPAVKPNIKDSPGPLNLLENDPLLSSVTHINEDCDNDCIPPVSNSPPGNNDSSWSNVNIMSQEYPLQNNDAGMADSPNFRLNVDDDNSQVDIVRDGQDIPNISDNGNITDGGTSQDDILDDDAARNGKTSDSGISTDNAVIPDNNSSSLVGDSRSKNDHMDSSSKPDSNIPDNGNQRRMSPPTSSVLSNSQNTMENVKLQEQQLCNEETIKTPMNNEVPSTSAASSSGTHKNDCGAEGCSSNGASSTVCLCTSQEKSKRVEASTENTSRRSSEAYELVEGLRAVGCMPFVRQLLQNVHDNANGETRLSQMETEIKSLENQITQKRKAIQVTEMKIKTKAKELEKLFESVGKRRAECEELEQRHKARTVEKSGIEAQVKKCLEFLNAMD